MEDRYDWEEEARRRYDWEEEARRSYEKEMLDLRATFDNTPIEELWEQALLEGYDLDWRSAILEDDWRTNRCPVHDHLGGRCRRRKNHQGKHDATLNGYLQFLYDEKHLTKLLFEDNPLLRMLPR